MKSSKKSNVDPVNALVGAEILSTHDAEHIRQLRNNSNEPLDQIVTKLGLIAERDLSEFYATLSNSSLETEIDALSLIESIEDLNHEYCELNRILPHQLKDGTVGALVIDPFDENAIEGFAFAVGSSIDVCITTPTIWEQLFDRFKSNEENTDNAETSVIDFSDDADRLKDMASEEPIVRLVSRIITKASGLRASDIHIEPGPRESIIKLRIDGVLHEEERLAKSKALSAVSRLKILAQLDIAERRRPQDGRLTFPVGGYPIDLRVSTIPTEHGESVVIRLLDQSTVSLNYDALGFSPSSQQVLRRLITKPNGIVLVTGPTGSGKTTTLYTMLDQLADGKRKILTIEDPIEQRITSISQTQANPAIDLTFANALKSFLRHDPDIIMVGEIRDLETARIAIQAALTGHLVLSTLHTNDAASTITRLLDMGIENYLIASTLNGVVAQRLVRKNCPQCDNGKHVAIHRCGECKGSGFVGRMVIAEILEMNDHFQQALRNGWSPSEIASVMNINGFISMETDGFDKANAGLTDPKEILGAVGNHD